MRAILFSYRKGCSVRWQWRVCQGKRGNPNCSKQNEKQKPPSPKNKKNWKALEMDGKRERKQRERMVHQPVLLS